MTTKTIREGDTVLVRCKVEGISRGHGGGRVPGINPGKGFSAHEAELFDIVTVEHAFRVGDTVRLGHELYGEIIALSPKEVDPPQAWIRERGKWPLATRGLDTITRVVDPA